MKNTKLKHIITEIVLKMLNEARFDFPKDVPLTHMSSKFDVPISQAGKKQPKKPTGTGNIPIQPSPAQHKPHPFATNERTLDTETVPTNVEGSEDPINDNGKFDGLNMTRSVK